MIRYGKPKRALAVLGSLRGNLKFYTSKKFRSVKMSCKGSVLENVG